MISSYSSLRNVVCIFRSYIEHFSFTVSCFLENYLALWSFYFGSHVYEALLGDSHMVIPIW